MAWLGRGSSATRQTFSCQTKLNFHMSQTCLWIKDSTTYLYLWQHSLGAVWAGITSWADHVWDRCNLGWTVLRKLTRAFRPVLSPSLQSCLWIPTSLVGLQFVCVTWEVVPAEKGPWSVNFLDVLQRDQTSKLFFGKAASICQWGGGGGAAFLPLVRN